MNILWLSWRDIKNPTAGGAEKVAIETASRFAKKGTNVTIFTSRFKNSKQQQTIRGVKIIRRGNLITCRFYAFLFYLKNRNFDVVIDEINTVPFFSIFYARRKSFPLIHQLAKEYWFAHTFWPLGKIGYFLEPYMLKLYKNRPTLTLSNSTKRDLAMLGFGKAKIYRIGLDFKPEMPLKKEDLVLFLGRLAPAKKPQDAIAAFSQIHTSLPGTRLKIVGRGKLQFVKSLNKLVLDLGLSKTVSFEGYATDSRRLELLKRAKIVLIPAVREGWNLVATEANAAGAIPIGYNVPGLRDSITNGSNGILVENPGELAKASISLLKNDARRQKIAGRGFNLSKKFSWENCYHDFSSFVTREISQRKTESFLKWLIPIIITGFLIRLAFAILLPLDGFDEAYDILVSKAPLPQMLQSTSSFYPPAWHMFLNLAEKFSQNYHFLRIFSVVAGTGSIAAVAYLGRKIMGNGVGLASAAVFALSPTQIYYSSILRLYSFSIFISILVFLSFSNFVKSNTKKSKLILLFVLTLGNYTYYLFPMLYLCFALYLFLDKSVRGKLKSFIGVLALCAVLTIPLLVNFLSVEKGSGNILPSITLLKIASIPLSYSFPINLTMLTGFYPYFQFNFTNIGLLFFSIVTMGVFVYGLLRSKSPFLVIPLITAPLIALIFSYNVASVFGLRSFLIFSIPFYLLIAKAITSKKLGIIYSALCAAVVGLIFVFFIQRQVPPLEEFFNHRVNRNEIIIHTELITFSYFSYMYPHLQHLAAVDSLYTNSANKQTLNYIPLKEGEMEGKTFLLLEYPTDIHKTEVDRFKMQIGKTHRQTYFQDLGEASIYKYEAK